MTNSGQIAALASAANQLEARTADAAALLIDAAALLAAESAVAPQFFSNRFSASHGKFCEALANELKQARN